MIALVDALSRLNISELGKPWLFGLARLGRAAAPVPAVPATLLIECNDEPTAEFIAGHKLNTGLCERVGGRRLVVRLQHEERFRALVRTLGLGIAASEIADADLRTARSA